jgi:hypothetical protein
LGCQAGRAAPGACPRRRKQQRPHQRPRLRHAHAACPDTRQRGKQKRKYGENGEVDICRMCPLAALERHPATTRSTRHPIANYFGARHRTDTHAGTPAAHCHAPCACAVAAAAAAARQRVRRQFRLNWSKLLHSYSPTPPAASLPLARPPPAQDHRRTRLRPARATHARACKQAKQKQNNRKINIALAHPGSAVCALSRR